MAATLQFVLLFAEPKRDSLQALPVPEGPSFLLTGPRRRNPRLAPAHKARPAVGSITLEPVELQRCPYLLMLHPVDHSAPRVHHNGQRAWPVTLLRVGDEVHVGGQALFVSSQRSQAIFPPEQSHLGVKCPLCTLEIGKQTLVFACGCGVLMHCEDDRWPAQQRLECARLASVCPNCQQTIDFEEGLQWEPEL